MQQVDVGYPQIKIKVLATKCLISSPFIHIFPSSDHSLNNQAECKQNIANIVCFFTCNSHQQIFSPNSDSTPLISSPALQLFKQICHNSPGHHIPIDGDYDVPPHIAGGLGHKEQGHCDVGNNDVKKYLS